MVDAGETVEGRSDGARPGSPDTAEGHAQVFGFEDHPDALGLELVVEPVGHLLGEPLLDLEASGEMRHDPGQLGQPEDPVPGEVSDVGHALEGKQVMLAKGVEGDVPDQYQLVVALFVGEGGGIERPGVSISA
jgi:hypothetical protein